MIDEEGDETVIYPERDWRESVEVGRNAIDFILPRRAAWMESPHPHRLYEPNNIYNNERHPY